VILRLAAVEAETIKPFAAVEAELRTELAATRAKEALRELHDKIEDQRVAAKPLSEIATAQGLTLRQIAAMDQAGRDPSGAIIADIPDAQTVLRAIFASGLNADNEAIQTRDGGWIWFELTKVDPARDRTLDETRSEAEAAWRADEVQKKLSEQAAAAIAKLDQGVSLKEALPSVEIKTATGIKRETASGEISRAAAVVIFGTDTGKSGTAAAVNQTDRLIFRVTGASVTPYVNSSHSAEELDKQLADTVGGDILAQYIAKLQSDLGVSINQTALRQAFGFSE
jgi:peptidyl-prolyl cis-trans isomerase D